MVVYLCGDMFVRVAIHRPLSSPSRPVPSRPVPSRPVPSRPVPSRPVPSPRAGRSSRKQLSPSHRPATARELTPGGDGRSASVGRGACGPLPVPVRSGPAPALVCCVYSVAASGPTFASWAPGLRPPPQSAGARYRRPTARPRQAPPAFVRCRPANLKGRRAAPLLNGGMWAERREISRLWTARPGCPYLPTVGTSPLLTS